MTSGFWLAF